MIRRRVVVRGDVQGVFFRDSCRQQATSYRVSGWVRNRSDGAVEAVFEGADADVEAMCTWCKQGPTHANVSDVEVTSEEPTSMTGFEVRG